MIKGYHVTYSDLDSIRWLKRTLVKPAIINIDSISYLPAVGGDTLTAANNL